MRRVRCCWSRPDVLHGRLRQRLAQEPPTRAEALARRARGEVEARSTPPEPGRLERVLLALENGRLFERLLNPARRFYPKIGNITRGQRLRVRSGVPEAAVWRARRLQHVRRRLLQEVLDARRAAHDARSSPAAVSSRTCTRSATTFREEDFFGLGPDSQREDHVDLRTAQHRRSARPAASVPCRGSRSAERRPPHAVDQGQELRAPRSAALRVQHVPGLIAQPDFLRYGSLCRREHCASRAATRARGGRYALAYQRFDDRDLDRVLLPTASKSDVQQYISLLQEPPRARAARRSPRSSDADAGQRRAVLSPADARRPGRPARLPPVPLPRPATSCCCRPSTAGRSSPRSTARSSTTPARSRHATRGPRLRRSRVRLRHRLPVRHDQRRLPPRRGRVRQQRRQALHPQVRPCLLDTRAPPDAVAGVAVVAAGVPFAQPAAPRRGSFPTIRSRSTTTGARRQRGDADRGQQRLRLRRAHLPQARRPPRHPRGERQHDGRGARLELVHQPDRPAADVDRRDRPRARIEPTRSTSTAGRSCRTRAPGITPGLPGRPIRRAVSIRSSSIRRRNPEMASGAEVIGAAIYHALGYNVVAGLHRRSRSGEDRHRARTRRPWT